ncbi:unnamed protein product [Albugo candida]|uniref:UVR domain-containing protein n=1 Tax=Albugo candida TaxID=65357 RepID=A0A024GHT9_9STRA|nr:unnamed protein product [Albugo candida]|eukprot:CCI46086.1 unnamed protein product [Albugo candida]
MFNRFFKKEEGANKQPAGPPAFRNSYNVNATSTGAGIGSTQPDASTGAERDGGGFFNLPPSANSNKQMLTSHNTTSSNHGMHSSPASSTLSDHTTTAVDMFGGMSVKQPTSTSTLYTEEKPVIAPSSESNSLFNGLDVVSSKPLHLNTTNTPAVLNETPQRRRSTAKSRPTTFNYLDTVQSKEINATSNTNTPLSSSNSAVARALKVKKKKKTFRPGFGRQLSEDAVAALQRGDIQDEEIVKANTTTTNTAVTNPIRDFSEDLTSLLPPLPGKLTNSGEISSVLAGLTVHNPILRKESSTSILAGLTVHTNKSPASFSVGNEPSPTSSIHSTSSILYAQGMPKVTESKEIIPPDVKLKLSYTQSESLTKSPLQPSLSPIVPQSLEERFTATLRDFSESAFAFHETVSKQSEEESCLLERKMQLKSQLTQYEIDLRQVEANQQRACEEEDFEKADALNTSINSVRHCITLTESDLRKVDSEFTAFLKGKERTFVTQLRTTRGTFKELNTFCQDQEQIRADLKKNYETYQTNQLQQLQFENERIQTELHHVSVTLKHVTSERDEIEARITEQCKSEIEVQKSLEEEKQVVEEEVRELERQLSIKKARVTEIQMAIDKAEKEIDVVRNRFSRQVKRISDREEGILRTKSEVEADVEHLKEQKEQFIQKVREYQEKIMDSSTQIKSLRKAIMVATLLTDVLEMQEARREDSLVRKKERSNDLNSLSDKAAIAEQSVAMLRKQQEGLEKSLAMHANAKASADSMIPRLESEKKAAATQRNFKEAARISKDIKALEKDRNNAEEMSEVVEMELLDLLDQIKSSEERYKEHKKELINVEKAMDLETLEELSQEYKDLGKAVRKMERCCRERGIPQSVANDKKRFVEGNLAKDQSSQSASFLNAALVLIKSELDACVIQIQNLEKKHDIHQSFDDEDEEISDDDESSGYKSSDEEKQDFASQLKFLKEKISSLSQSEKLERTFNGDAALANDSETTLEGIDARLAALELEIEKATESEDYEVAAQLDEQFDILSHQKQKILDLQQENVTMIEGACEIQSEEGSARSDRDQNFLHEKQQVITTDEEEEEAGTDEPDQLTVEALENSINELEVSLKHLYGQEEALESAIARASDEDNFDAAAEYDEELNIVCAEIEAAKERLDTLRQNVSDMKGVAETQQCVVGNNVNNLFAGLGVKIANDQDNSSHVEFTTESVLNEEERKESLPDSEDFKEHSDTTQMLSHEVEDGDTGGEKLDIIAPSLEQKGSETDDNNNAQDLGQECEESQDEVVLDSESELMSQISQVSHSPEKHSEMPKPPTAVENPCIADDDVASYEKECEEENDIETQDAKQVRAEEGVVREDEEAREDEEVEVEEGEGRVVDEEMGVEDDEGRGQDEEVEKEDAAVSEGENAKEEDAVVGEEDEEVRVENGEVRQDNEKAREKDEKVTDENDTETIDEENTCVTTETDETLLQKSQYEATKTSLFDGLSFVTNKLSQLTSISEQTKMRTEDSPPDSETHQDKVDDANSLSVECASL